MEFGDLVSFLCRFLIPRNCSHSAENYISATHRIKYQNILNIKILYILNINIYINNQMYKLERKLKESLLEVNEFGNIFRHLGFISYKLELRRQNSYPVSSVPK